MAKLFYDKLTSLKKLERYIKQVSSSKEEEEELWKIVDDLINKRVLTVILDRLDEEDHEEFLSKFHEAPHDEGLFDYLKNKIKGDATLFIKEELISIGHEILDEFRRTSKSSKKNDKS